MLAVLLLKTGSATKIHVLKVSRCSMGAAASGTNCYGSGHMWLTLQYEPQGNPTVVTHTHTRPAVTGQKRSGL